MVLFVSWNEFLGYGVAAGASVLAVGSAAALVVRLVRLALIDRAATAPADTSAQDPPA